MAWERSRCQSPGHISECAVAVVAVEAVLSIVGGVQILKAIVVVVANAHTLCPTSNGWLDLFVSNYVAFREAAPRQVQRANVVG